MKLAFGPATFSTVFCCAYAAVYWFDLPLFLYYPLNGEIHLGPYPVKSAEGPAMAWYGLMASAALVAAVTALAVPERWISNGLKNHLWLFPLGTMLVCVFLLRVFFR